MEIHKRLQYVDFLKGFAILCVVVGHIASFNPKCDLLIDFVYSFHMPLFFFISGFLFHKKNIVNIQKSIISKVKSLIIPYLSISVLAVVLHGFSEESIYGYFCSETRWGYWFLPTLFIMFLFLIVFRKRFIKNTSFFLAAVITEIGFCLMKKLFPPFLSELFLIRHLVTYWPFMILGLYMNKVRIRLPIVVLSFIFWASIIGLNYFGNINNELLRTLGRFLAIYSLYGFFVINPNINFIYLKPFTEMGKSSLVIYMFHFFLLQIVRKYLEDCNNGWSAISLTITLAFIISFCCWLLEHYVLNKNKILSKMFVGK